jgi:hypothetical protein
MPSIGVVRARSMAAEACAIVSWSVTAFVSREGCTEDLISLYWNLAPGRGSRRS